MFHKAGVREPDSTVAMGAGGRGQRVANIQANRLRSKMDAVT